MRARERLGSEPCSRAGTPRSHPGLRLPAPGLHYSPPGPPRGRTKNHGFFDTLKNLPRSSINRPRAPPGPPRGAQGSIFSFFWMPFGLHFHDFSSLFLKTSEKWKSCSCVHRDTKIKGSAPQNPSQIHHFPHHLFILFPNPLLRALWVSKIEVPAPKRSHCRPKR